MSSARYSIHFAAYFTFVLCLASSKIFAAVTDQPPSTASAKNLCLSYYSQHGTLLGSNYAYITLLDSLKPSAPQTDGCLENFTDKDQITTEYYSVVIDSLASRFPGSYPAVRAISSLPGAQSQDFRMENQNYSIHYGSGVGGGGTGGSGFAYESSKTDSTKDTEMSAEGKDGESTDGSGGGGSGYSAQEALLWASSGWAAQGVQDNVKKVWTPQLMDAIGLSGTQQKTNVLTGRDPLHYPNQNHGRPLRVSILEDTQLLGALLNLNENTLSLSAKSRVVASNQEEAIGSVALYRELVAGEVASQSAATVATATAGPVPLESNFMLEASTTVAAAWVTNTAQYIGSWIAGGGFNQRISTTVNGPELYSEYFRNVRLLNGIPCWTTTFVPEQLNCSAGIPLNNGGFYKPGDMMSGNFFPNAISGQIIAPVVNHASLAATLFATAFYRTATKIGQDAAWKIYAKAFTKTTDQSHLTLEKVGQNIYDSAVELYGNSPSGPMILKGVRASLLQQGIPFVAGINAASLQNQYYGAPLTNMTFRNFAFGEVSHPAAKPGQDFTLPNYFNAYHDSINVPSSAPYVLVKLNTLSALSAGNSWKMGPMDGTYMNTNIPTGYTVTSNIETDATSGKVPVISDRAFFVPRDITTGRIAFSNFRAWPQGHKNYPYSMPSYELRADRFVPNGHAFSVTSATQTSSTASFNLNVVDPSDPNWNMPSVPNPNATYSWIVTLQNGSTVTGTGKTFSTGNLPIDNYISIICRRNNLSGSTEDHVVQTGVRELLANRELIYGSTPATGPLGGSQGQQGSSHVTQPAGSSTYTIDSESDRDGNTTGGGRGAEDSRACMHNCAP